MTALIECVPNFSEGRDRTLIDAIADAIAAPEVMLLDIHSDADHHRTVYTFAGTPDAVEAAMLRAARIAVERIDLTGHRGQHPRIGAVDVIPFVPLEGITLHALAGRARTFARHYAEATGVPVYLYEASALRPGRVNLADIRRGGYEGLREAVMTDPARAPDFGAARLGAAGATVIGARAPLIAFNAYLDSADVTIARSIARTIRESSGGLACVRAIGVQVGGRAQVSINVIDFRRTSLYTIMRAVDEAARQHGAAVVETELVGLMPQAALLQAGLEALRLPPQAVEKLLERRLGAVTGNYREVVFE